MTVGAIYQLIFFLAIALLAITITVFVLAVSLLGRAVRLSVQEQMIAEQRRKEDTENEIKKIQAKLEQAKSARKVEVEDLVKSLRELEEKDRKHRNRLRWIKIKPKLLTANWGALLPGALFLGSALLSGYALYYKDIESVAGAYAFFSIIALGAGILIVALTLRVIEGVAITSEDTSFAIEAEALKTAMIEVEDAKRPEIKVAFKKIRFPLEIKSGSELTIRVELSLTKGDFAQDVEAYFGLPPGFDFPNADQKIVLSEDHDYPGFVCFVWEVGTLVRGISYFHNIKITASSVAGDYKLIYQLAGRGLKLRRYDQRVIVK